jgi:hypothetical protein
VPFLGEIEPARGFARNQPLDHHRGDERAGDAECSQSLPLATQNSRMRSGMLSAKAASRVGFKIKSGR